MAETSTTTKSKNVMVWDDPVVHDELFGPAVKNVFWSSYGIMALARIVSSILFLVWWFDVQGSLSSRSPGLGAVNGMFIFLMIDAVASVVFTGGLVASALLVSRAPAWARVTMLSVAAVVLIGSNALSVLSLSSLKLG